MASVRVLALILKYQTVIKNSLVCIAVATLLISCSEPVGFNATKLPVEATQRSSSFLFAGLPVEFRAEFSPQAHPTGWSFGDGKSSDGAMADHTYDFPGSYNVSALLDNRKYVADTNIVISPRLNLIGSKTTSENGKYIFEKASSGYSIIHTLNSGSSVEDWMLVSTTETFEVAGSSKLAFDWYADVFDVIVNSEGNIVMLVDGYIKEINRNGLLLREVGFGGPWTPIRILETSNGYLVGGFHFDGTLRMGRFNDNLEKLSEVQTQFIREGFEMNEFCMESDNVLRLHYYESGGMENPSRLFVKTDIAGNVLFEKPYSPALAPGRSYRLTSGYLLQGGRSSSGTGEFVFTRVDDAGEVMWSLTSRMESQYPGYVHSGRLTIIEDGAFVFIFFDNQKGMKVNSSTGEVKWLKRFGTAYDTFDHAIKNGAGNFVILASHQFDYTNFEYTPEYNKRDLMLLEIDTDGYIVPR
jgi:PKD repeat protein